TARATLLAGALAAAGCGPAEPPPAAPRGEQSPGAEPWSQRWSDLRGEDDRPLHVVLVTLDTLRADRLGSYGGSVDTPHLDRLAREGARFTNAASTVPFTLPAHSSILTGTYPPYHGVRENVGYYLSDATPTLAELLGAAGYRTGGFVSAFVLDARWGVGRGFERYYDDFDLSEEQRVNLGDVQRDGRETLAEAERWLDQRDGRPFFLWLHLFDAHDPYTPAEPWRSRYPDDPYSAEVAYVDSLVGDLRAALERRDLLQRTLLVVTADHGEGLGEHGELYHGYFVYDTTVHVPLIVRAPFPELAGRVVEEAVSHVDLAPTVLAAAGVASPPHLQGASLLPLVLGAETLGSEPLESGGERVVYSESLYPLLHYGWAPLRAVRGRRSKHIEAPQPELYDLAADPGETRNLYAGRPREAEELARRLAELREAIEVGPEGAGRPREVDAEALAQLQALGYVAPSGEVALAAEDDADRPDPKDKLRLHQLMMGAQSDMGGAGPEAARRKLEQVLALDDQVIDAHQLLGQLANDQGDFARGAEHFKNALALAPDHRSALFGLATAYWKQGRLDEALVGFERVIELAGYDSKASLAMARILAGRGERERAVAALRLATEPADAPAALVNDLGELLAELGQVDAARGAFERARREGDQLAPPWFNLAVLAEDAGEGERAAQLYRDCVERAPKHFKCLFNLGRLQGSRGDLAAQAELWQRAVDANPDFVRGAFLLAKLLMDTGGDLARAEAIARAALERDPDHRAGPLGHYVLADILNRLGRVREAQEAAAEGRRIQAEQAAGERSASSAGG
ncbi:MAG TPA: sulfatase-like hydrolase/transferase, partial [Thermoanaerobaculia bacterium]|nr:sulfatase-like hydrolase/transferase [Thermoanaerobaculia bacterium]